MVKKITVGDNMEHEQTSNFSDICLDKRTIKVLKFSLKDHVVITDKIYPQVKRLQKHGMVQIGRYTSGIYCGKDFCEATYRGESYFSYFSNEKKKERKEFWRYLITTIIAVLALFISALALLLQVLECLGLVP